MKTLVVSSYGVRLRYRNGLFIVEDKENKSTIPPSSLNQIIIVTGGVSITSKAVRTIIDHGIDLVFLDSHGLPIGRVYPPFINRTVETRRSQYIAYGSDKAVHIIREIIYSKIMNQSGLLMRYYRQTYDKSLRNASRELTALADEARSFDGAFEEARRELMIMEAQAARIYWPMYAQLLPEDLDFDSRDQDSTDPVNVMLNYSYGILYKEVWKALVLAGLDPYAGYMHVDRSGKPVLVFDFIEQFRFIADYIVLRMLRRGWRPVIDEGLLKRDSRAKIISYLENFMDKSKTRYYTDTPLTLRQAMKRSALQLASFLRGKSMFQGFIWEW